MQKKKQFEILKGLPLYGPMYVSVSESGMKFYYEGFVVRFFKKDGSSWVANFKTGQTQLSEVFELCNTDKIVVIANGQGYIMTTEIQKPISTFGFDINAIIKTNDNRFITSTSTELLVIEPDGSVWRTERISLYGIKNLTLENNIISGLSLEPGNYEWKKFSFDINNLKPLELNYPTSKKKIKKPFWKFW